MGVNGHRAGKLSGHHLMTQTSRLNPCYVNIAHTIIEPPPTSMLFCLQLVSMASVGLQWTLQSAQTENVAHWTTWHIFDHLGYNWQFLTWRRFCIQFHGVDVPCWVFCVHVPWELRHAKLTEYASGISSMNWIQMWFKLVLSVTANNSSQSLLTMIIKGLWSATAMQWAVISYIRYP